MSPTREITSDAELLSDAEILSDDEILADAEIPTDAEIDALVTEINAVSSNEMLRLKPALEGLLSLIKASDKASPAEVIRTWLSRRKSPQAVERINASDMKISQITEIFDLEYEEVIRWTLVNDSLVDVPSILKRHLRDLRDAQYDIESEVTCRIAVDIIIIQCRKHLHHKYQSTEASQNTEANVTNATGPSSPKRAAVNLAGKQMNRIKVFPESSLSVEMRRKFLVTGRADWAMGYNIAGEEGTLLIAIEAKQRSEFGRGEAQLIAYLAILRENRIRAKKTNTITQGFYTDGSWFVFIYIAADGTIERSTVFDIELADGLKMVFNFIISMIETAMKSNPNATPSKPGQQQEKEVKISKDEVWTKIYALIDESLAVDPDDETDG